jgi:predicted nuclease of predicted toxin-antitoxin system
MQVESPGTNWMAWVIIDKLVAKNPPTLREARQVLTYASRGAKARFYADENFPAKAVQVLRAMGAKVRTAQEVGLTRHPDENHIAYARRKGMILVTCDRDFLDEKRFPLIHCPATFVFDFGSASVPEIRQAFRCLASALRMPQFFDKWWKIDAKRDCWTELVRHQDGSMSRHRMRVFKGSVFEWVD